MEELKVEQTVELESEQTENETTETQAQAQRETEVQPVSYGKFKDASALLNAYNSLEAEFTKRCQKIKELEAELSVADKASAPAQTEVEKEELDQRDKEDLLKTYVREVFMKKQSAIVLDGTGIGVKTPVQRPKTFDQAGKLAVEILRK